ncbi:class I glutamine amidotransferase-like protein [Dendrothele bispora CBS 962.96]|uniref:Class I glutamine amidotransferase-like protein n=1 Tax=Dendrothele bispora (strain CBS 962.96) TaxID=1314807 RepID=A0A4V6T5H7_DENBC|nr:class I glutamine amidotransferase-like protein [Dendrothele bispora CBS 962.96]
MSESSANPENICKMAVCIYPGVTMLDFQGPVELLCCLSVGNKKKYGHLNPTMPIVKAEFLSHSMESIRPDAGPDILPSKTYEEAMGDTSFDIIMIPGGSAGSYSQVDPSLIEFLKRQGPNAKYILTICTGSWILAGSGLLNGKRATTNKAAFKRIVEDTKDMNIEWVPKARWVVNDDKKIWTSSGVTAGQDLACAFLDHLVGKELADVLKNILELSGKEADDDEFAGIHGLV